MHSWPKLRLILAFCALGAMAFAQVNPTKPFTPPEERPQEKPAPKPGQPQPGQQPGQQQPAQQQPGQQPVQQQPGQPPPAGQPAAAAPAQTAPQTLPPSNAPRLADIGSFSLPNVSLTEMIDILARHLKINYILDPAVKGSVSVFTYGEVRPIDYMPLLETILRVNGAAIVKVGEYYRIVPINRVSHLPLEPQINPDQKTIPDDERMTLNLIFLKYAIASEMLALLKDFMGESATASVYEPANLLIIQDNARNMRRTLELINLFDGDQFASQRVRLFELENTRPSDMRAELEQIFKAFAMSDKAQAVKFLAVDNINTLIAIAPNPGVFDQVAAWIKKLDVAVKSSAGAVNSYVYRLRYGRAETIAMAIMALYSGNPYALVALGAMAQMQNQSMGLQNSPAGGMYGGGMYGGGMYGGGMGGYGGMNLLGMMGGMMGGGMYPGTGFPNMYGQTNYYAPQTTMQQQAPGGPAGQNPLTPQGAPGQQQDLTGSYLGQQQYQGGYNSRMPHVIPNPFDNTILIQGTAQDYEQILGLLRQLDVPPRQVLIDARIYEVDLDGALSAGVNAFLEQKDANGPGARALRATTSAAGLTLNAGALVLRSKEILAALSAQEARNHSRVISAPSIIATDSVPAVLNVGAEVPVLTSQAVAGGVQQSGSSLFTNTIASRSTGVTLNITARVNSSGIVTMVVNQNVSSPQAPPAGGIQSPSFQNRSFETQLTVQDGDTVAIGGIILENDLRSSAGVPFLSRLPGIGFAFGAKSVSKSRTELIVFLTPRVIYDSAQMIEATDEIKREMKRVQRLSKDIQ
jgi:general secretion pathway protein D